MAIVLIGDEESEPEIVAESISRSFPQVHVCKTTSQAAELVEVHAAELIIFFLSSIDSAENRLQSLYGVCSSLSQRDIKLLVLCRGTESEGALQLCREGIFDDFLIAQPLQDATQLHWVIERLLQAKQGSAGAQFKVIQNLEKDLQALKKSFSEITDLPVAVREHIDTLENSLDQFLADDKSDEQNTWALEDVIEKIQGVRQQTLTPSLRKLSNEIETFTKSLTTECEQHFIAIDSAIDANKTKLGNNANSKLLLVDDNEGFRHIVHEVLESEGYSVIAVSSAKKAISLILREKPGLVLVDYEMPEINGIQMIHDINQLLPSTLLPPFIMVTGYSLKNIVEESAHLGVVDFIVKPIRRKTLIDKVKRHISHQGVGL
jgi:CheY-like chemotaxis protein